MRNSGGDATLDSVADLAEAAQGGVLQLADDGNGGTLVTIPSGTKVVTLSLDGIEIV